MKKRLFVVFVSVFLITFVFAGNIIVDEFGIQADNYYSSSGNLGFDFEMSFSDLVDYGYRFVVENGLIVNVTNGTGGSSGPSFPSEGLVSYYSFDETSGCLVEDSYNETDGFNNGMVLDASGKIGSGIYNDGTVNNHITINQTSRKNPLENIGSGDYTINLWVNFSSISSYRTFFSVGRNVAGTTDCHITLMYHTAVDEIIGSTHCVDGPSISLHSGVTPVANAWYMVTFKREGSNFSIWINNEYKISDNDGGSISGNGWENEGLFGEGIHDSYKHNLNGLLDEVGIWNRALSLEEIGDIWNDGAGLAYS